MTNELLLIPSASYVSPEMRGEFGALPPALLPVRGDLLIAEQFRQYTGAPQDKLLTLPESFVLAPWQERKIAQTGLNVLRVPYCLSLGASVIFALNMSGRHIDTLHILHGDTIITDLDMRPRGDAFSAHTPAAEYEWDVASHDRQGAEVMSGYFCFTQPYRLVQAITAAGGDFVAGIHAYHAVLGMEARGEGRWYDFGHLQTFYKSRRDFSTERAFNTLTFSKHTVHKSSADSGKMAAEASWFRNMPMHLQVHAPRLISVDEDEGRVRGYELEYLHLIPLSDLFVFCDLPLGRWSSVLKACGAYLESLRAERGSKPVDSSGMYRDKTLERLATYSRATNTDLEAPWILNGRRTPSLSTVTREAWATVEAAGFRRSTLVHGDFHFDNILFDFRAERIQVIDPRGRGQDGVVSLFGDPAYDLAKLYHSAVGFYDLIVSGLFSLSERPGGKLNFVIEASASHAAVSDHFLTWIKARGEESASVLHAMTILLFLSMLPLHAERPDRQRAFMANALRLHLEHRLR
jgi:hypothetical protein